MSIRLCLSATEILPSFGKAMNQKILKGGRKKEATFHVPERSLSNCDWTHEM